MMADRDRWWRRSRGRFATFIGRYGHFFRTRARDNAAVARRYLRGLAQAENCTFAVDGRRG